MFAHAVTLIGQHLPWVWPILGAGLGGVCGSFLSCAASRLPRGCSLWQPPSQCGACGTQLGVPDLIPLISWLILRGRCRHCGTHYGAYNLRWEVGCITWGVLLAVLGQPGPYTPLIISAGLAGLALLVCAGFLPDAKEQTVRKRHTPPGQ